MSDTISPSNPNAIDLNTDLDVWRFPVAADRDSNPAAEARAAFNQQQYVDYMAAPDTAEPVNTYETVPPQEQVSSYATHTGEAVDPQHAEAVLVEAARVVANAATPEMIAAAAARNNQERHNAAVAQAGVYAIRVEDMRDSALLQWGAEGDASVN
jgi:hypothetical protein